MGLISWYDERVRSRLGFDGVPTDTVQRHFDLYDEFTCIGFDIRADKEVKALFAGREDSMSLKISYRVYLSEQTDRLLKRAVPRMVRDAVSFFLG